MPVAVQRLSVLPVAASVLACAVLVSGTARVGAQEPGAEDPLPEDPQPVETAPEPVLLELVDQSTWVEPRGTFEMTVAVAPDGSALPDDASVSVGVYSRLLNRSQFDETLFGLEGRVRTSTPVDVPVPELERNADGELELGFDVTAAGLVEAGVYPLEVQLTGADGQPLGNLVTHVLVQPEASFEPLDVAVVVELGAPPAQQPDGTTDLAAEELIDLRARADLLAASDSELSVAPVPETLDSLARATDLAAGDLTVSDEAFDDELLDDLEEVLQTHQVLARPYVDLDLEAWASAGLLADLPSETDRGARVLRRLADVDPVPGIWLPGATVGQAEVTAWREAGVVEAILPQTAVAAIDGEVESSISPLVALPDGPTGFVSDDGLVDRLLQVEDPLTRQRFIATLAMIWFERPGAGRSVVLRVPSDAALDSEAVATTFDELGPSLALLTATELFAEHGSDSGEPAVPVTLEPKTGSDDLDWLPQRLKQARVTLASLANIVPEEELRSLERSLLIAPGAETDQRRAYVDRVDREASRIAEAIGAPDEFQITLTDRNGVIPLTITNELDEEVAVRVELSSNQLEFRDGNEREFQVPPGGGRFDLRVRTRTSGAFPLHVTLTSSDGAITFDETTFDIRSTAISGVGLVLSIGAGLFLVVWWARNWRRTRRDRAQLASAE